MRIFILALLLPAYGLAAVHAQAYGFQPPASGLGTAAASLVAAAAETPDDERGGRTALLSELSDTTDDVCDHCMAYAYVATTLRVRLWNPPLELPQVPDAVLRRALRPPSALPA